VHSFSQQCTLLWWPLVHASEAYQRTIPYGNLTGSCPTVPAHLATASTASLNSTSGSSPCQLITCEMDQTILSTSQIASRSLLDHWQQFLLTVEIPDGPDQSRRHEEPHDHGQQEPPRHRTRLEVECVYHGGRCPDKQRDPQGRDAKALLRIVYVVPRVSDALQQTQILRQK
jgi:hypothetical protein